MCRQPLDWCVPARKNTSAGAFQRSTSIAHWARTGTNVMLFLLLDVARPFPRVMKCHKVKSPDGFTPSCATFPPRAIFQQAALGVFPRCLPSCTELRLQAELRLHVALTCSHRSAARPHSSWTCSISVALQHCAQRV